MVTCFAKVIYPNGHWHYTKNLVVEATAVR